MLPMDVSKDYCEKGFFLKFHLYFPNLYGLFPQQVLKNDDRSLLIFLRNPTTDHPILFDKPLVVQFELIAKTVKGCLAGGVVHVTEHGFDIFYHR